MSEALSKIPNGFRYYSARDARVRRTIEEIAMSVFDGWSYEEIVTPSVDYYSLFEVGMGKMEAQRAFRFSEGDGQLLALRPDVTSGIARAAATLFAKRERPLRFCYAAKVFRQRGQSHADWRRELTQIGCELLGRNSKAADIEVLAIAAEVLGRLGLNQVVITLSDVEIFNGIVENLRLDADARDELRRLVDIRAVAELECFLASYASDDECSAFANLIQLSGKQEIFNKARRVITNARSLGALDRLESLWRVIDSLGMSGHFEIDLGDVSRLDYYTGLTFEIYVAGIGARIGSGGRYDNLTAKFGKAEPAVGFVLELDALADLLSGSAELMRTAKTEGALLKLVDGDVAAVFGEAIVRRASDERVKINADEVISCRN
jgi:ATP phosphoribosyltransferase regulatory subunit